MHISSVAHSTVSDDVTTLYRAVADGRSRLPGPVFTSEEIFELERSALLKREWMCIGTPHHDLAAGSARPVSFLGQNLILARTKEGALRMYHNFCRHRGAELLAGEHRGNIMVCPYHNWSFDLHGRCRQTPHVGGHGIHSAPEVNKDELSLYGVRVEEWAGLLFLTFNEDAGSLEDYLAPLTSRWGAANLGAMTIDHSLTTTAQPRSNWKLVAENFVESYHVPSIHRDLQKVNPMADHGQLLGGDLYIGQRGDNYSARYLEMGWQGEPIPGITLGSDEYEAIYLFPNTIITLMQDHAFSIVIEPAGPAMTRETINWHFHGDAMLGESAEPARKEFQRFLRQVNDEDIGIVESMQRARGSAAFDGGVFTEAHEQASAHLQKLYALRMLQHIEGAEAPGVDLPIRDIASASA
jgi:choline monooxygenase